MGASTYSPRNERIASFTGGEAHCEFASEQSKQSTWLGQRSIAAQNGTWRRGPRARCSGGPDAGVSRGGRRTTIVFTQIPRPTAGSQARGSSTRTVDTMTCTRNRPISMGAEGGNSR